MSVAFRVDASVQVGTGHFTRCLTLASALRARGSAVRFLCRDLPPALVAQARVADIAVHALSVLEAGWQADARESVAVLDASGAVDALVVDHYSLDAGWERAVRASAGRIMAIDDVCERAHDCDLLLDLGTVDERKRNGAPRTLCGPAYALLRPEFATARAAAAPRLAGVARLLVTFGGSDPTRETEKTLAALRGLRHADLSADIVVGAMNPRCREIEALCAGDSRMRLHVAVGGIASLMQRADLAVGAAGGTAWERCCLYLPSLLVVVAENQYAIAESLAVRGAAVNLGRHASVGVAELHEALHALIAAPQRVADMSHRAGALVDGEGVRRVVSAMEEEKCV